MKSGTLLQVEWKDASVITEWLESEEVEKELDKQESDVCVTVGFFVRENKKFISLSQTISKRTGKINQRTEIMSIPKGMIISKIIL